MDKVTLDGAFASIDEHWDPKIAAELNGQAVKLAVVDGEFVWHCHDDADELFLVSDGELRIDFRDRENVTLRPGELLVVPRGVAHRPVALEETRLVLFEPTATRNTGNVENERTRTDVGYIE